MEAPETPAPVFAFRAFKSAFIGTPQPAHVADISHMEDLKEQETAQEKATTTTTTRRRVVTVATKQTTTDMDNTIGMSPTKPNGILMTPGTTRRNKSVSFGAQVVDNEGKKQSKSGLPNNLPGKFPSPFTPKLDFSGLSDASTSSRNPTKLTAALQEVRDSSQKARSEKTIMRSKDDTDITLDLMEPRSQSGKYWKQEYDSYAEKTQREMKKLVIKQRAAKSFAKDKDMQCLDLANKIRDERKKVEKLEAKTTELATQMKAYQAELSQRSTNPSADLSAARAEIAKLCSENQKLRQDLDTALGRKSHLLASPKPKSNERRTIAPSAAQPDADIWADVCNISSPFIANPSPKRASTNNTTPLKSRDVNTLDNITRPSPKRTPQRSARGHKTSTPRSSRNSDVLPEDSINISLALPRPSPEPLRATPRPAAKRNPSIDDLVEKYTPAKILPDGWDSPLPAFDRLALPVGMVTAGGGAGKPVLAKENVAPVAMEGDGKAGEAKMADTNVEEEKEKIKRRNISDAKRAAAQARIAKRRGVQVGTA